MVYSHSGEGDHRGPHLCFRGIDNRAYYRLGNDEDKDKDKDKRSYRNYSGCGNSFSFRDDNPSMLDVDFKEDNPPMLDLIIDNLHYWIEEMHVDGFRFDLASAVAKNLYEVDRLDKFFCRICEDPVISQVKLIAESWNLDGHGYQVKTFPPHWAEFNDDYRDAVRDFWRGDPPSGRDLARRLSGSTGTAEADGRSPAISVNFVTNHDTFTLQDLVSYNEKHNEANGEGNEDGLKRTTRGTAVTKVRSTTRWSSGCESSRNEISLRPCSCLPACQCYMQVTNGATRSWAIIIPIARTTRSRGSTGG